MPPNLLARLSAPLGRCGFCSDPHHAESQPQQQGRYQKSKKTHVRIRPHSPWPQISEAPGRVSKIPDDGRSQKPIKTVPIPPPRRSNIRHIASSRTCSRRQVTSSTEEDPVSRRPWSSCPISALEARQSCTTPHHSTREAWAQHPCPCRPGPFHFLSGGPTLVNPFSLHFHPASRPHTIHWPPGRLVAPRQTQLEQLASDELTPRLDADALLSLVPMGP